MEKSAVARHYRYDHYHHTTPQQKTNGKTASLKHAATVEHHGGCLCFGGRAEGGYVQGVFSNLGICALLVGYTLLGSFVFMAIEGGGQSFMRGGAAVVDDRRQNETSSWLKRVADESRARTVENIWDITVSLNILYRDNWTRLAAQEISRFQDQLVQRLSDEMMLQQQQRAREMGYTAERRLPGSPYEWNFARAFLYSLTVLTTIGYGNIAPRTALGKAVTMGYAVFGIPLMLIYLSSVGSLLSRCVRGVFSRTVCCCFCSNCGYCCYDEKRMQEKERRMKKKRMQEMEMQQQQQQQQPEPFYVRSSSSVTAFTTSASSTHNNLHSPVRDGDVLKHSASMLDQEYGGPADNSDSNLGSGSLGRSYSAGSIMAPILLCLLIMLCYICGGAAVLTRLEAWSFLDGSYFCFMSLSTIGFGDLVPGGMVAHYHQRNSSGRQPFGGGNGTVWFCSMYILTGMALTAMCFNILHDEIVHRLRHTSLGVAAVAGTQVHQDLTSSSDKGNSYLGESGGADPYSTTS